MKILGCFIIGFIVAMITATIEHGLNFGFVTDANGDSPSYLSKVGEDGWYKAIILGLASAIARGIFAVGGVWAVVSFVIMLIEMIYLAIWWWKDGDRFGEFLGFLLLEVIFYFILAAAAAAMVEFGLITGAFWVSVWQLLPTIVSLCVTGFMLITLCQRSFTRTEKGWQKVLAWIFLILYLIALGYYVVTDIEWKELKREPEETVISVVETPEPTATPTQNGMATATETPAYGSEFPYFYNTRLFTTDNDPSNDFNFGSNPLANILKAKVKDGKLTQAQVDAAKSDDQKLALVTPKDFDQNLRERMANDPALGAAVMAWFDANLGTRYLGEFYDECASKWDAAMNAAKVRWMGNQKEYNRTLAAFYTFLDSATKVEVLKVQNGLDDQMYMNPFTTDLVPDIIVRKSAEKTGYFLRYSFNIKGDVQTVAYRIDCGYQPVNVAKVMNITPQPVNPTPTPTPTPMPTPTPTPSGGGGGGSSGGGGGGSGGGGGGGSGGGGGGFDPTPPPPTTPVKDPTKGTVVPKNDNPGPGPDTNNGVGEIHSSEDLPTNSSAFETYDDYQKEIEELAEINKNQKVGGDPNTPSYTPVMPPENNADGDPARPKPPVDSNADKGTGNGGIDNPTPVEKPVEVDSDLGGTGSVADDPVGTEWGGPPD